MGMEPAGEVCNHWMVLLGAKNKKMIRTERAVGRDTQGTGPGSHCACALVLPAKGLPAGGADLGTGQRAPVCTQARDTQQVGKAGVTPISRRLLKLTNFI